jgi:hypothetical protein
MESGREGGGGGSAADLRSPRWGPTEISTSTAGTDWTKYKRFIQLFVNDSHVTHPADWA